MREADLVSCATLSTEPLVKGAWLKRGAHLDLVGAFNLRMREADDEAVRRAAVFVDTRRRLTEGGDVALALESGAIAESDVARHLSDLCRGTRQGPPGRGRDHAVQVGRHGARGPRRGDAGVAAASAQPAADCWSPMDIVRPSSRSAASRRPRPSMRRCCRAPTSSASCASRKPAPRRPRQPAAPSRSRRRAAPCAPPSSVDAARRGARRHRRGARSRPSAAAWLGDARARAAIRARTGRRS